MRHQPRSTLTGLIWGAATALAALVGSPRASAAAEAIPLIQMSNVPIEDAIRNLARQGEFNCILDPRVPRAVVNARFEHLTVRQALQELLKEHKLKMVENPGTTVARIAPAHLNVKPIPAAQVATDTNAVIRSLSLDCTLADALKNLAGQAHLNVSLPPELTERSASSIPIWVSVHWQNITPRQALAALLDNYGLVLSEDRTQATVRIKPKEPGAR